MSARVAFSSNTLGIHRMLLLLLLLLLLIIAWLCAWIFRRRHQQLKHLERQKPVCSKVVDGICQSIFQCPPDDSESQTLAANFQHGKNLNPNGNCLGFRPDRTSPYHWITYTQANDRLRNFAAGLKYLDCLETSEQGHTFMAIYMKNRPEWVLASQGLFSIGGTVVTLYDSLGENSTEFILNQTQLTTVVCTLTEFRKLLIVKPRTPSLKCIILCGKERDTQLEEVAKLELSLQVYIFEDVEKIGAKHPTESVKCLPADIATLMYTSGTSGTPKGALLSHGALIAGARGVKSTTFQFCDLFQPTFIHFSYLPLAHVFETIMHIGCFYEGGAVGFYQGDPLLIIDDLCKLRPTVFVSVPRLLNKIHSKIMMSVQNGSFLKKLLFNKALKVKQSNLESGVLTHKIWDQLIFSNLKKKMGLDRCYHIATGSAPISPDVVNFFRVAFCMPVLEGYALTESCGGATVTHFNDYSCGHVGGPVNGTEIKLDSVPEMGYNTSDCTHKSEECMGRGEICIRGPSVFSGYFKMPRETSEAVDNEGWLHSGDIGLITKDGKIKIIDRKKNIFKLSHGEYVAPEKIENFLNLSNKIEHSFVYGDSRRSKLVGIIVPDTEYVLSTANSLKIKSQDFQQLCEHSEIHELIRAEVIRICKSFLLPSYEIISDIFISSEQFSIENGIFTPTFKLKRSFAKQYFANEIEKMYSESSDLVDKVTYM